MTNAQPTPIAEVTQGDRERLLSIASGCMLTAVYGSEWCAFPDVELRKDLRATLTALADAERKLEEARTTIRQLERKISFQKHDAADKDRTLSERNKALDGMAWVWCDGGCSSGVGRFSGIEVTEEIVSMVERNTKRLRTWFRNKAHRQAFLAQDGGKA